MRYEACTYPTLERCGSHSAALASCACQNAWAGDIGGGVDRKPLASIATGSAELAMRDEWKGEKRPPNVASEEPKGGLGTQKTSQWMTIK